MHLLFLDGLKSVFNVFTRKPSLGALDYDFYFDISKDNFCWEPEKINFQFHDSFETQVKSF